MNDSCMRGADDEGRGGRVGEFEVSTVTFHHHTSLFPARVGTFFLFIFLSRAMSSLRLVSCFVAAAALPATSGAAPSSSSSSSSASPSLLASKKNQQAAAVPAAGVKYDSAIFRLDAGGSASGNAADEEAAATAATQTDSGAKS